MLLKRPLRINLLKIFYKILRKIKSTHQWVILVRLPNCSFIRLKQPRNVSRADPFVVKCKNENKIFIFFEEFDIEIRHGYLCVGELDYKNRKLVNVQTILKCDYHLSFPNVFRYQDKYYMIPESSKNFSIDLYVFTDFPYKVKKIKTLLRGISAADTVFYEKDGYCYILSSIKTEAGDLHSKNLSLFYSDNLLHGEFKPHPMNPISTSAEFSRNAGSIFKLENDLYRVSQNCSLIYGSNVNLMRIKKFSEVEYEEILIGKIYPPHGYIAFHTYNELNGILVADAKLILFEFRFLIKSVIRLVRKVIKKLVTC